MALSLEYWLQLGPKMKKGAPKRSRKYKKMSSIGKITGTVCRLTHNDGIKRQFLHKYCFIKFTRIAIFVYREIKYCAIGNPFRNDEPFI